MISSYFFVTLNFDFMNQYTSNFFFEAFIILISSVEIHILVLLFVNKKKNIYVLVFLIFSNLESNSFVVDFLQKNLKTKIREILSKG
jgi:hypothetical protein